MKLPTPRQIEALEAIDRLTVPRGPTVRELCAAIGVTSTCTGQRHIDALERRGLVTRPAEETPDRWGAYRVGCKARGVMLTEKGRELLETFVVSQKSSA